MKILKIRYLAYLMGILLLASVLTSYFVINSLTLSATDDYQIRQCQQVQQYAYRLQDALQHFTWNSQISDAQIDNYEKLRSSYLTNLVLLEKGGKIKLEDGTEMLLPPLSEDKLFLVRKIKNDWIEFSQDIEFLTQKDVKAPKVDLGWIARKYKVFLQQNDKLLATYQNKITSQTTKIQIATSILAILGLMIIANIYAITRNLILIPLKKISLISRELAKGNLSSKVDFFERNEIGYIAQNINDLADILNNATNFSREIGAGNLEAEYKGKENVRESSIIGALEEMRVQLKNVAEKDRQERWISTGLTQFADVIRDINSNNLPEFGYSVVSYLVSYLKAHQGAFYILNDDTFNREEHFIEAKACYAMNKRKYLDRKIRFGEGLVGQGFIDKETLHLQNVPQTYDKVGSALGATLPRNVLIVPILYQEASLGVIEILSLKEIKKYEVAFVEKVCETIANDIYAAKTYDKNRRFFIESEEVSKRLERRSVV